MQQAGHVQSVGLWQPGVGTREQCRQIERGLQGGCRRWADRQRLHTIHRSPASPAAVKPAQTAAPHPSCSCAGPAAGRAGVGSAGSAGQHTAASDAPPAPFQLLQNLSCARRSPLRTTHTPKVPKQTAWGRMACLEDLGATAGEEEHREAGLLEGQQRGTVGVERGENDAPPCTLLQHHLHAAHWGVRCGAVQPGMGQRVGGWQWGEAGGRHLLQAWSRNYQHLSAQPRSLPSFSPDTKQAAGSQRRCTGRHSFLIHSHWVPWCQTLPLTRSTASTKWFRDHHCARIAASSMVVGYFSSAQQAGVQVQGSVRGRQGAGGVKRLCGGGGTAATPHHAPLGLPC